MAYFKKVLVLLCAVLFILALAPSMLLSPREARAQGDVLELYSDYTLTGDYVGYIKIMADNVTLNLNSHSIICPNPGTGTGVCVSHYQNINIINGNIKGFTSGIELWESPSSSVENIVVSKLGTEGTLNGIFAYGSLGAVIRNNICQGSGIGIGVSSHCLIEGNLIQDSSMDGIHVSRSSYTTITGNTVIDSGWDGINVDVDYYSPCRETNINGNSVQGSSEDGIRIAGMLDSHIVDNDVISSGTCGIRVEGDYYTTGTPFIATGNFVSGNHISNSGDTGIQCNGEFNTFSNNVITGGTYNGIRVNSGDENNVSGNQITECQTGLHISQSESNRIEDNIIDSCSFSGIYFYAESTSGNILRRNQILNCKYNLYLSVYTNYEIQDIDSSNTVDGKPVYYLIGQSDMTVPEDAGLVALINCNNVIVNNQHLSNNSAGVLLLGSTGCTIENVEASNNSAGIFVHSSPDNVIRNCNIHENGMGIYLRSSSAGYSSDSVIISNNIEANEGYGITIGDDTDNNTIYHNNFIENNYTDSEYGWCQACNRGAGNIWDDGYPNGGNYWSNPDSFQDDFSGANQDEPGSDGIIDSPYNKIGYVHFYFRRNGEDRYPLVKPVDITEDLSWSFAIITDIHMGCFYDDYGGDGWNDDPLSGQPYFLINRLRDTIARINELKDSENIKFVAILGDFTDSAECSEFAAVKDVLEDPEYGLDPDIPYVPVFGNHDIWPYTRDDVDAPWPNGSQLFEEVFEDAFNELSNSDIIENWEKDWEFLELDGNGSPLQSYAFDVGDIHFLVLDCVNRQHAPEIPGLDSHGAAGSGAFHQQTEKWVDEHLDYWGDEPTIIFSHHPFYPDIIMHFAPDEYVRIAESLAGHKVIANFAGHVHSCYECPGGPIVEDFNTVPYPNIHPSNTAVRITEAVVAGDNQPEEKGFIRLVQVNPDEEVEFESVNGINQPAHNAFFTMEYTYLGGEEYNLKLTPRRFTTRDILYRWNFEGEKGEWREFDHEWHSDLDVEPITFTDPAQSHKVAIEAAERTAIDQDENDPANLETYYQEVYKVPWREELQEGDILLHRSAWTLFDKYLEYTHAGIYVGGGLVAEAKADWDGGVALYPIENWDYPNDTYVSIYRVNTIEQNREAAAQFAEDQTSRDTHYDYLLVQRDSDEQSTHWYCSELVWASYYSVGIDLAYNGCIGPSKAYKPIPPDDIRFDDDVTLIGGHYEYYPGNRTSGVSFRADCPVDLSITDPDGMVTSKESCGIEDAAYLELDIDNDGVIEDVIDVMEKKIGNYEIAVVPGDDASPEDVYSIEISVGDEVIYSSPETKVGEIPGIPYVVNSSDEQVVVIPQITSIDPEFGTAEEEVTISGLSFGDVRNTSSVAFGEVQVAEEDYISWSDREISCKVPAGVYGPVQITVTTDGGTSNSVDFSVKKDTVIEPSAPETVQYSDPLIISAVLKDDAGNPLGNLPVTFTIDEFEQTQYTDEATGIASLDITADFACGTYDVLASYAGDESYMPTEASTCLEVIKESVFFEYTGAYTVTVSSTPRLSVTLTEEDDGSPGDITKAGEVAFELYDPTGALVREAAAPIAEASPWVGEAEVMTDPLPANVYTVKIRLADNGYYQAEPVETQLVVYDPDGGFATGGGFLCDGGFKTFGFCVKPSHCDPWLPKGNLLFVDLSDIRDLITVKAEDFAWLVIPIDEDIAYIAGTCKLNRQDGYTFYLTVEDLGGWFFCLDTFYLVVKDDVGNVAYEAHGTISGGNIKIHR